MVICPDCGKEVKDAKFCSNCGASLPKIDEVQKAPDEVVDVEDKVVDESFDEVADVDVEQSSDEIIDVEIKSEPEDDAPEEIIDEEAIETSIVKKSTFCPNCGAEIKQDVAFCPQCGFKLIQEQSSQTKFCQNCGKKIDVNAEICPHCGVRVAGIVRSEEKSVFLAAILSFLFPGLGHLYNGLTRKGVSFIIAYVISAILIFILIGFVLVFIVWIWALIDSIKTTEAINSGEFVEDKLF